MLKLCRLPCRMSKLQQLILIHCLLLKLVVILKVDAYVELLLIVIVLNRYEIANIRKDQ